MRLEKSAKLAKRELSYPGSAKQMVLLFFMTRLGVVWRMYTYLTFDPTQSIPHPLVGNLTLHTAFSKKYCNEECLLSIQTHPIQSHPIPHISMH